LCKGSVKYDAVKKLRQLNISGLVLQPTVRLGDVADLKFFCPEPLPIEKLKMKITTKSQIEKLLPEPKPIRITAADCYSFCPPYNQTACCRQLNLSAY
jgi:hypothetical protein